MNWSGKERVCFKREIKHLQHIVVWVSKSDISETDPFNKDLMKSSLVNSWVTIRPGVTCELFRNKWLRELGIRDLKSSKIITLNFVIH